MITQQGIRCPGCQDEIYSNSGHDFVSCRCGASFVDGGFEYLRVGYSNEVGEPTVITRELETMPPFRFRDEGKQKRTRRKTPPR
jgi:hypothetical protein